MEYLVKENVWINKSLYEKAETEYHENLAKAPVTPLAGEVAKARQLLIQSRDSFKNDCSHSVRSSIDVGALKFFEKKVVEFEKSIEEILGKLDNLESRVVVIEKGLVGKTETPKFVSKNDNDDDDVDLFGSDSEEESETAAKIREERLAAYNAKKSKKPALIAKSNVILDIKPWDDETNMKEMENAVRKIETDGLLWGAAKLVPLAYGIHKLQISCVVEDEKVSIDWLQEELQSLEDYIQSVDIAAFNKI